MTMIRALLCLLLLSLVPSAFTQSQYSFTFLANETCMPYQLGECVACAYSEGYPTYYYQVTEYNGGSYGFHGYYDSACSSLYTYGYLYYGERCNPTNFFGNCYAFYQLTSATVLSLTLSSTDPISATYLGEAEVYTQVSKYKATAQGESLTGFQLHSAGSTFFVERQLSSTQYSSSLGIFSLGETYTHPPFTFSVTSSVVQLPLPLPSYTSVTFYPILTATVTSEDGEYTIYHEDDGEIEVYLSGNSGEDATYTMEDLVLSNPFYSVVNMTLYPPYTSSDDDGLLVFQLEASSSPFLTVECYHDSGLLEDGYSFNNFECGLGSLSFLFSLSLEVEHPKPTPDEMSFNLF